MDTNPFIAVPWRVVDVQRAVGPVGPVGPAPPPDPIVEPDDPDPEDPEPHPDDRTVFKLEVKCDQYTSERVIIRVRGKTPVWRITEAALRYLNCPQGDRAALFLKDSRSPCPPYDTPCTLGLGKTDLLVLVCETKFPKGRVDAGEHLAKAMFQKFPLHWLAKNNHREALRLAVAHGGVGYDALSSRDDDGMSPLDHAVRRGHHATAEFLLDESVEPGGLLGVACEAKDGVMASLLMERGACFRELPPESKDWLLESVVREHKRFKHNVEATSVCSVCLIRPRESALNPCGHLVMCKACAEKCDKCPVCSQRIVSYMHIFQP